jgi:hypothetical protein
MTDKEKFLTLMQSFGLEVEVGEEPCYSFYGPPDPNILRIDSYSPNTGIKQEGYGNFFSQWHFDLDGKFVKVGFWE